MGIRGSLASFPTPPASYAELERVSLVPFAPHTGLLLKSDREGRTASHSTVKITGCQMGKGRHAGQGSGHLEHTGECFYKSPDKKKEMKQ